MLAEKLAYDHHVVLHEVFANLLEIRGATSPTPAPVAAESVEARMSSQVVPWPPRSDGRQFTDDIFLEQITNRYWRRS